MQTLLNLMLMAAALLWLRGSRISPAILIGLTCWLKPQMILFLLVGAAPQTVAIHDQPFDHVYRRSFPLGCHFWLAQLCGIHPGAAISGSARGFLFWNQSLNGLLHRLMHVGSPVTSFYGYPPFNRTIYLATLLSSAAMVAVGARRSCVPADDRNHLRLPDLCHGLHHGIPDRMAAPLRRLLSGVLCCGFPRPCKVGRRWLFLLPMYLLMTDTWAPLTPLMFTRWSFPISHVYFGGLALFLYTLFRERSKNHFSRGDFVGRSRASGCAGAVGSNFLFNLLGARRLATSAGLPVAKPSRIQARKGDPLPRWELLPAYAAQVCAAVFCADFLTMFLMNVARLKTVWLPTIFLGFFAIAALLVFRHRLVPSAEPTSFIAQRRRLTLLALLITVLLAATRLPYLLEGHLHHLVGPVVYDDTWHFQEINSLAHSAQYPAHCSLIPTRYFSLYYAPWMMIVASTLRSHSTVSPSRQPSRLAAPSTSFFCA